MKLQTTSRLQCFYFQGKVILLTAAAAAAAVDRAIAGDLLAHRHRRLAELVRVGIAKVQPEA